MTMMERVLELPDQLRWGAAQETPTVASGRPVVMLGMGGSAMGASVAALAASGTIVAVHRAYGLPRWAAEAGALVVGVSFSGNTEETLSGIEEALEAGLPVAGVGSGGALADLSAEHGFPLVAVPGGLQPRAAVGYQASAALRVLEGAGAVTDAGALLAEAADVTARVLGDGAGPGYALGVDLGEGLAGGVTIVYGGAGPAALAAYRWKTQINENAKAAAWWHEFPELNHNEIQGWESLTDLTTRSVGAVFLRDPLDHPQVAKRMDLTWESMAGKVKLAGDVIAHGSGPVARFFSLAAVGDVASVAMAQRLGVDPTPVATIERFKQRLAEG